MKTDGFRWLGFFWKLLPKGLRVAVTHVTQDKFIVSVVAVVTNEDGKVLILDHVLRPGSGWGLPGGFMESFEQPEESIRRELREEVGLELEDVRLAIVRNLGRHIEVIYRADAVGEARVMSREIVQFGWFDPTQLPADLNVGQKTLVGRILADKFD